MRLEVPSARSPGYFLIISEFCFGCRFFLIRMPRIKIIEDLLHDPQSPASPSRQMRDGLRDKAYARRSELQRQTKCLRRRLPTHWREAIVAPVPSNASRNVSSRPGAFVRPRRFTRSLFSSRSNHKVRKMSVGGAVLDRTFRWPPREGHSR